MSWGVNISFIQRKPFAATVNRLQNGCLLGTPSLSTIRSNFPGSRSSSRIGLGYFNHQR